MSRSSNLYHVVVVVVVDVDVLLLLLLLLLLFFGDGREPYAVELLATMTPPPVLSASIANIENIESLTAYSYTRQPSPSAPVHFSSHLHSSTSTSTSTSTFFFSRSIPIPIGFSSLVERECREPGHGPRAQDRPNEDGPRGEDGVGGQRGGPHPGDPGGQGGAWEGGSAEGEDRSIDREVPASGKGRGEGQWFDVEASFAIGGLFVAKCGILHCFVFKELRSFWN